MCLCLAWNETEPNVLAIGHDRYRSDSCITIWDIERGLPKESGKLSKIWMKNKSIVHKIEIFRLGTAKLSFYPLTCLKGNEVILKREEKFTLLQ